MENEKTQIYFGIYVVGRDDSLKSKKKYDERRVV